MALHPAPPRGSESARQPSLRSPAHSVVPPQLAQPAPWPRIRSPDPLRGPTSARQPTASPSITRAWRLNQRIHTCACLSQHLPRPVHTAQVPMLAPHQHPSKVPMLAPHQNPSSGSSSINPRAQHQHPGISPRATHQHPNNHSSETRAPLSRLELASSCHPQLMEPIFPATAMSPTSLAPHLDLRPAPQCKHPGPQLAATTPIP